MIELAFNPPRREFMTTQAAFTPDEWTEITRAPLAASLLITMASPSIFGSMGEIFGATRSLVEGAQQPTGNELLDSVLAEFKDLDKARNAQPQIEAREPAAIKSQLLGLIGSAVALMEAKATSAEVGPIKQWLYDIAARTANATREGGFLGIGAVRVSDAETQALNDLASLLDLTPAAPAAPAT
jgi:hypothetical protein